MSGGEDAALSEASHAPLVLADARRVRLVADELAANRMATGRPFALAVVSLGPDGAIRTDGGASADPRRLVTAREILVLATGRDTAGALQRMLEAPLEPTDPASLLRGHPRLTVICDAAAAARLRPRPGFTTDRVLIVLGHREPGISPEHRISAETHARMRHAVRIARRVPVRAVILTGYTSTGGLSEAEQMKVDWDESLAPALLEVAGRDTAENASRSLPIVLAMGTVRHVLVVSSAWHVRVPWFFAPYRRFGLHVGYRVSFAHGNWPRMLAEEARQLPHAPARRREAMATVRLSPGWDPGWR